MTIPFRPRIVVLIPAHNEEKSILATLRSQVAQDRRPDLIVLAADNCTDRTVELARSVQGVTVFETENNTTKKPGALNQAWHRHCGDADLVVTVDADTTLDPTAVGEWEAEFLSNPSLGGCSAKFTMFVDDEMTSFEKLLVRVQRSEFAKWTDLALKRSRKTNVLAGTACCVRNDALQVVADWRTGLGGTTATGPWMETSVVEDFELTYRMRQRGWQTKVSASVRAYTDAMTDLRSLWAQRMKWQIGTVSDLLDFGVNRLTLFDWWQQALGLLTIVVRVTWVVVTVLAFTVGSLRFQPIWLIPPVLFVANDVRLSFRIPECRPADILVAALMLPQEACTLMRAGWFAASWWQVLSGRASGALCHRLGLARPGPRDRWTLQARAERKPADSAVRAAA